MFLSPDDTYKATPAPGPEDLEDAQELTDEELYWAERGMPWCPEPAPFEDEYIIQQRKARLPRTGSVLPSAFTAFAFRMPKPDGTGYEKFSFEGRRHMIRPYDTPARRVLLVCARQTEKSTLLGNKALGHCCLLNAYKVLYVSPSSTQTKTFSNDRIKDPSETSPILKSFTTTALSQNIFEKQYINRSKITMRYAFLNADRTRGIPAHELLLDEFQDILADNIPIIEQCTSHAPEELKRYVYAGTPKSLDNNIEYYRVNMSTQGEWVVPCDACGSTAGAGRYWNILGEKNIGKKGLSCERCGKLINPMHDDAQWAFQVAWHPKNAPFESYRIPQLMVPWKPWDEILLDYKRYPRDMFYNEVLGISFDSGMRPLTQQQVKDSCVSSLSMHPRTLEHYQRLAFSQDVFMGIDWGCHDEETRILTEGGFKYFRDLTDDDKVAQWDPDTREMTFVTPKVRTVREWDQPLLHFTTKGGLDLMVTHTHRMRVRSEAGARWVTESAGELVQRRSGVQFVGSVNWTGVELTSFTLPGVPKSAGYAGSDDRVLPMADWVEFVGYLLTEGGLCFSEGRPSCLKMSQRVPVNQTTHDKIQSCLDRLQIPHTAFPNPKTGDVNWTIYGKQYWRWYQTHIGELCSEKRLPREFLTLSPRLLRVLFDAMMAGDGSSDPREGCHSGAFYSTSKGLCEDFQEVCIRLGLRAIVRLHKEAEGNRKTRWRVLWSAGRDHQVNHPSEATRVPYTGKVYCCAVPSGYIVTERNGCIAYQGNTGESGSSYTVVTLGTYIEMKYRVFLFHRFEGEEAEPPAQLAKICELVRQFNVRLIGADYGGGFDRNDHLVRQFGPQRVQKFQYMARTRKKVEFDNKLLRWKVHRTEVMSDIFNAIKRKQFEFPRWEEFKEPYGQDMLNIFSEYNETLRMTQYSHGVKNPDDAFHSLLYGFLASIIARPRPDIIAPQREEPGRGPQWGGGWTPVDQGLGG